MDEIICIYTVFLGRFDILKYQSPQLLCTYHHYHHHLAVKPNAGALIFNHGYWGGLVLFIVMYFTGFYSFVYNFPPVRHFWHFDVQSFIPSVLRSLSISLILSSFHSFHRIPLITCPTHLRRCDLINLVIVSHSNWTSISLFVFNLLSPCSDRMFLKLYSIFFFLPSWGLLHLYYLSLVFLVSGLLFKRFLFLP